MTKGLSRSVNPICVACDYRLLRSISVLSSRRRSIILRAGAV